MKRILPCSNMGHTAAPPKCEVQRHGALGHSNDGMAVPLGGDAASHFAGSALSAGDFRVGLCSHGSQSMRQVMYFQYVLDDTIRQFWKYGYFTGANRGLAPPPLPWGLATQAPP